MRSAAKLIEILLVATRVNSFKVHPAVTQYCRLDDWTTFLADSLPFFMSDFALVERNIKFDSEAEGTPLVGIFSVLLGLNSLPRIIIIKIGPYVERIRLYLPFFGQFLFRLKIPALP
jgi:hypothetical protein